MSKFNNPKAMAWDAIEASYWNAGYNGGPIGSDIDQYLMGVTPATNLIIIGASTRHLIGAALERARTLTVLDFSSRMCAALAAVVDTNRCEIIYHDITTPVPERLCGKYDLLLADRLINRFTEEEALLAFREMLKLLNDNGEIRTAIRLGFYQRDMPLIEEGRRRNTLSQFFDERTWTINYAQAGSLLDEFLAPHGSIPKDLLLKFYRLRGPEKRFTDDDIMRYAANAAVDDRSLTLIDRETFSEVTDQTVYRFRAQPLSSAKPS